MLCHQAVSPCPVPRKQMISTTTVMVRVGEVRWWWSLAWSLLIFPRPPDTRPDREYYDGRVGLYLVGVFSVFIFTTYNTQYTGREIVIDQNIRLLSSWRKYRQAAININYHWNWKVKPFSYFSIPLKCPRLSTCSNMIQHLTKILVMYIWPLTSMTL